MDALTKLISSLEIAIRYLLTGAVVATVAVLSRADYARVLELAAAHIVVAAGVAVFAGFTAFTFYRLVLWVVLDLIAWKGGWSAPSVFSNKGWAYDKPYASFLKWRQSDAVGDKLSGYLTYRWAVAHFASVSGITLILASCLCQQGSLLSEHSDLAKWLGIAALALGTWQTLFFYRVERDLCKEAQ